MKYFLTAVSIFGLAITLSAEKNPKSIETTKPTLLSDPVVTICSRDGLQDAINTAKPNSTIKFNCSGSNNINIPSQLIVGKT